MEINAMPSISSTLRRLSLAMLTLFLVFQAQADNSYEYRFEFEGIADTDVLLAYHYGDKQYIVDTFHLDSKGAMVASADSLLPHGMYMVVFPSLSNQYFEFMVAEPEFSVTGDVNDLVNTLNFKGSEENKVFYDDLRYLNGQRSKLEPLQLKLTTLESGSEEFESTQAEIDAVDEAVNDWRDKLFEKHADKLYVKMLWALQEVPIPDTPTKADGSQDEMFPYRFAREHAFDRMDWQHEALLRTPAVYNLIYRYLNNYTYRQPDSIIVAVDNILEKAKANEEMFKYVLITLLNDYGNSELMGMDKVYVHIALNYYNQGQATWLDEAARYRIVRRAQDMSPTLIDSVAPNFRLKDLNGNARSLHDFKSKYTVLFFWDPDCSHCREETPVLKEMMDSLEAIYDIKVVAVNTQLEIDKWLKFIDRHQLGNWYHLADFDQSSDVKSLYDIRATPKLFLLDSRKRIIAKRLAAHQLGDFLDFYDKNKADKEQ